MMFENECPKNEKTHFFSEIYKFNIKTKGQN